MREVVENRTGTAVATVARGVPTTPSLPPSLKRLVELPVRYSEDFSVAYEDGIWKPPATVTQRDRDTARQAIVPYDRFLQPAAENWLKGRVATLLAHYFVPGMPAALQTGVASDWLTLLGDYPSHAVEQACMDWIGGDVARKPTPGEIKAACERIVGKARRDRDRLRTLANLPMASERSASAPPAQTGPRELTPHQQEMLDRLKGKLVTAKPRTIPAGPHDISRERPRHTGRASEILSGFQMPDDSDPAVQQTLRDMGTAE